MVPMQRAEIDFEYNDQITLGIETQIILNWPKQAFAALPVYLILSVVRFSGTVRESLFISLENAALMWYTIAYDRTDQSARNSHQT